MTTGFSIEKVKNTPMFFILGRPRTGSTLLRTLFDAHPQVIIPQEWPMLLLLHFRFEKVKYWDKKNLEEFYQSLFQPLKIPFWSIRNWPGIDLNLLHSNLLLCEGEQTLETLLKVVYFHYNSFFDKKEIVLIGDKNPAISNHPELLAKLFPTAKFIHLVRDYRDNLVSLLEVKLLPGILNVFIRSDMKIWRSNRKAGLVSYALFWEYRKILPFSVFIPERKSLRIRSHLKF
jgi:hypothetical protein